MLSSVCLSPLSGHWRGTPLSDVKPVSAVYLHLWPHRVDCSTPAYGEEPTVSEEERERSNIGWIQFRRYSFRQHRKWKEGFLMQHGLMKEMNISYGGTMFCCAVMWNLKLQHQTNEQFQSQVSCFIPFFYKLILSAVSIQRWGKKMTRSCNVNLTGWLFEQSSFLLHHVNQTSDLQKFWDHLS